MEYTIVDNIEEATHWVAYDDKRREYLRDCITVGKAYILELLPDNFTNVHGEFFENQDYFIRDDKGNLSMAYMIWRGDFVKETIKH